MSVLLILETEQIYPALRFQMVSLQWALQNRNETLISYGVSWLV